MGNKEAKPSIVGLVRNLEFLQDYWKEVGESLHISRHTLQEIDEDYLRSSQKKKLERVIAKWIEEDQCELLLPQLTRVLKNADFVQRDNRIQQSLRKLTDNNEENGNEEHRPIPRRNNRRCSRCWRCCRFTLRRLYLLIVLMIPVVVITMGVSIGQRDDGMDPLERYFMENEENANKLLEVGAREIRILVTGKTGTGKSALINGIMGDNVTEEGGSLDPMTTKVEKFKKMVRRIPMIVFDSPGLQDGTKKEKEYLLDMEQKCEEVDLVLYTLKMSDKRFHADDTEAMRKLTHAFGEQFWDNAMFVMTFANDVRDPEDPDDEASNMIFFGEKLKQWEEKLTEMMEQKLNVSKEVARRIPVVPAGYHRQPHLPGRRYWFSEFWRKALDRMRESSTDGYSLILDFQRDRFKRVYELTPEDLKGGLHKQPIVMQPSDSPSGSWNTGSARALYYLTIPLLVLGNGLLFKCLQASGVAIKL